MYYYKCGFVEEKKVWLGCILLDNLTSGLTEVVDLTTKGTEQEVIDWCKGSVESMNLGGKALPD